MQATPELMRPSARPVDGLIQQAYVTHCLFGEGLSRSAGFAVRSSSTLEPLLLRTATEYPAYELPPAFDGTSAPVRLAFVSLPGGQKGLIHSVPLPPDRGRANNFFSHHLFCPSLTPRAALLTWGSDGWVTDCATGLDRLLPPLPALPADGPLNDELLTAFLQPDEGRVDSFWPRRLGSGKRRRELLAWTLRGCLLTLQNNGPRSRLFILAEPELTALLLYGAVRLLPPSLTTELTFSTYEPARHTLRFFRQARVVGTLAPSPETGFGEELFESSGYFIDTFSYRCSPELNDPDDSTPNDWIEQGARGEWKALDRIYALLGSAPTSAVGLREGYHAAKALQRLTTGNPSAADLLALKQTPWIAGLVHDHREKLWPLIRDLSSTDPEVRAAYGEVVAEHVQELEQQVAVALQADPPGNWRPGWDLLVRALEDQPVRWREALQRLLPAPPFSADLRFALLEAMRDTPLLPLQQQQPLHLLIRKCSVEELERFARSELPDAWFAWALFYALARVETRADAVRLLHTGDDELLAAFWEQARCVREDRQWQPLLTAVLGDGEASARAFFGRSLLASCPMRADILRWTLDTLRAFEPEWDEFWTEEGHLSRLVDLLRELGPEANPVWDRLCGRLNGDLLLLAQPFQLHLLSVLIGLRERNVLPPEATGAVADWVRLHDHFERASSVGEDQKEGLLAACRRRGVDANAALRDYFVRYVLPRPFNTELLNDFTGFFHSFYPESGSIRQYYARLTGWDEVLRGCPDAKRRAKYRKYYLEEHIPEAVRARMTEEETAPEPVVEQKPATVVEQKPAVVGQADCYPLVGVGNGTGSWIVAFLRALPWLLGAMGCGMLAILIVRLLPVSMPPRTVLPVDRLLWYLHLPIMVLLADGAALQATAVALGFASSGQSRGSRLLRGLGAGIVGGLVAGVVVGALTTGMGLAYGLSVRVALGAGGAMAGAGVVASVVGFAVPALVGRGILAPGPIARWLAVLAGVALFAGVGRVIFP
jgi:GTPase-associated protein 1, N-terminal domain type 2